MHRDFAGFAKGAESPGIRSIFRVLFLTPGRGAIDV
jgi:hypothetical protein